MGQNIPPSDPTEFGADCTACFAANFAPKYFSLYSYGVVNCPGWFGDLVNGFWILTQKVGFPCVWEYSDANVTMDVKLNLAGASGTKVQVYGGVPGDHHEAYRYFAGPKCDHSVIRANQFIACVPQQAGKDGFAIWQPY